jgi:hypothetical protein
MTTTDRPVTPGAVFAGEVFGPEPPGVAAAARRLRGAWAAAEMQGAGLRGERGGAWAGPGRCLDLRDTRSHPPASH